MKKKSLRKEKIIILFNGTHLAYSPTVTQLYDALSETADVTIFAEIVQGFIPQKLTGRKVVYYEDQVQPQPSFLKKIRYFFLRRFNRPAKRLEAFGFKLKRDYYAFHRTEKIIRQGKYERIIAVDIQNLFYCTVMGIHADFISLELGTGENLLPFVNRKLIDCVISQSTERLNYLFKNTEGLKIFIIPNSPVFKEQPLFEGEKKGLLYGGTAWDPFGFYHCLDYLRNYKDTPLTVQGALPGEEREKISAEYSDLISEGLLHLNDNYLGNDDVVKYFSQFEIGICFYNFDVEWIRHFNYQSAPSGKMFKYLAAGVPVLAINIIGFKFIEEMNCGVLINDLKPESIRAGIEQIRSKYSLFRANTQIAAAHYSFDIAVKPYIDYVGSGK